MPLSKIINNPPSTYFNNPKLLAERTDFRDSIDTRKRRTTAITGAAVNPHRGIIFNKNLFTPE